MPTLTPTEATEPMDTVTPMPIMACTTARGPLRLSQRLMLMLTTMVPTDWATMVWATEHTDMDTPMPIMATTMARGPLMPSPPLLPSLRLMPTTATTAMVPGPTTGTDCDTEDTPDTMVWDTDPTGDKFSGSEVQSRSSKANITPCYLT